ncbi:helix-turn-helix domain-containing protein [Acinetobacter sp. ME22]|uniref:helix-turn-helix domain-containing protein n=1 Tax=Acinetobacter sp. ME22 TaxID=2904802 RepID=UPI001EDC80A9|nr:helix-turn-helix domain-containing protein [Acinetobacter sp. ME22]MCG2572424.1 helix-turn-helix domain-containing protein [Acinetobacter sp. ME22]
MSLDATNWAWRIKFPDRKGGSLKPLKKLVLLSLADRAGEDHTCYPSMQRLEQDTGLDRKTILKIISELLADNLIRDTGERKGVTKRVKVYKLLGVTGRETVPTTELLNSQKAPETVPSMEQSQQRNDSNNGMLNSPNSGTLNSPNNGTQNLPKNLPVESKNKKTWLCLKKLGEELGLITDAETIEQIKTANWFKREQNAFERYNADKNLCDDLMHYHFADWLLNARLKYQSRAQQPTPQNPTVQTAKPKKLSEKQINLFAQKLAHHPEVSSKFAEAGESYEQLTARIAAKLSNPEQRKKLVPYLAQVGFEGVVE